MTPDHHSHHRHIAEEVTRPRMEDEVRRALAQFERITSRDIERLRDLVRARAVAAGEVSGEESLLTLERLLADQIPSLDDDDGREFARFGQILECVDDLLVEKADRQLSSN